MNDEYWEQRTWVTTVDGCIQTANAMQIDFVVRKFVHTRGDSRQLSSTQFTPPMHRDRFVASAVWINWAWLKYRTMSYAKLRHLFLTISYVWSGLWKMEESRDKVTDVIKFVYDVYAVDKSKKIVSAKCRRSNCREELGKTSAFVWHLLISAHPVILTTTTTYIPWLTTLKTLSAYKFSVFNGFHHMSQAKSRLGSRLGLVQGSCLVPSGTSGM